MKYKGIAILGAGGFAREVYHHLRARFFGNIVFVDDSTDIQKLLGCKVIKDWKFPIPNTIQSSFNKCLYWGFIVGVGTPTVKKNLVEKALRAKIEPAPTYVHPSAIIQNANMGVGGIICPGVIMTTNILIGDYTTINLSTTIGHDTTIGDYTNIAPNCSISGNNKIGKMVNLGTCTATIEKKEITDGVITGAGSTIIKDLTQPGVYVGTPAKANF